MHTDQGFRGFGYWWLMWKAERDGVNLHEETESEQENEPYGGIIRLLLIILWAVVVVVLGFYSGLAYHQH
jgi:hypothetical protein